MAAETEFLDVPMAEVREDTAPETFKNFLTSGLKFGLIANNC